MKPFKISFTPAFLILLFMIPWITSCKHDPDISGLPEMCFDRDVLPIYRNSCAVTGCHDGTREMMALDSYTSIRNSVVPYNPEKSQSYKAIISTWGEGKMPPDQPLSQEKRTIIRVWIEQGANETTCEPQVSNRGIREDKIDNYR
jgi:hypothetical protein